MRKEGHEIRSANPFKNLSSSSLSPTNKKKIFPWILYPLLAIAIVHYLYSYPSNLPLSPSQQFPPNSPILITSSPPPSQEKKKNEVKIGCNYGDGKWVHDEMGPLYNGSTCGTIKDGQNCMSHGRPDVGYLHWRWSPNHCPLPRFDPKAFLHIMTNKHLAFVGDSIARNQLESLLCMLSSASSSPPQLVYNRGDDNKFRRWHFPSHNLNVSVYWSPFLVKGIEKSGSANYNKLYLDSVDESWGSELEEMDVLVLSVGHWFLHPAVYFGGDSVLGCHYCDGQNYTEIGFYDVFGKAIRTSLNAIRERRNKIDVVVTTFSPHHFEGEWDKLGACPKLEPYKEGEKRLEGMDEEMRRVEVAEIEASKKMAKEGSMGMRVEGLDITRLSLLRPDGHPGPYMYAFPFANGVQERVQNDCVHWCLPGPVDTWNEILLDVMKRWEGHHHT